VHREPAAGFEEFYGHENRLSLQTSPKKWSSLAAVLPG